MGDFDEEGDGFSVDTYMTHADDEDAFSFYLFDHTDVIPPDDDDFRCIITPPEGLDVVVHLYGTDGTAFPAVDMTGDGGTEEFIYSSSFGYDDEGTYTVVLSLYGEGSCDTPVNIDCTKVAE
jgi:hypothetical protein